MNSVTIHSSDTVLIDICGTVFDSNTTFDFLDEFLRQSSYARFRRLSRTVIWRAISKSFALLRGTDLTRYIAVRYLRDIPRQQLVEAADRFCESVLRHKVKVRTIETIEQYRRQGYRLVLASATLDFIAEAVARWLSIDTFFGSELSYTVGGNCRGLIVKDRLGHKLQAVKDCQIALPVAVTITDNLSDIDILRMSDRVWIVAPENMRRHWLSLLKKNRLTNFSFL